ncbi:MAG TPA: ABC transporter ATP-binding protein, partial [Candidatus Sulfotelmatobacter sp.]|nr:ABC transporter ATP-binding protein [Candidatus Sulfotelmatobacter sp.]
EVREGETVTLIGSNGAGKTTCLRRILGLHRHGRGRISFYGHDITALKSPERVRLGLTLVPEGRGILPDMSVFENLLMGAFARTDTKRVEEDVTTVCRRFPVLEERREQMAGTLSGGEQQMLALGRALMARPRLLMLDEPSLGLAPIIVDRVFTIVRELQAEGITILLVEQNARKALEVANRGYVLETGEIALAGETSRLRTDPSVRRAYLGAE